MPVLRFHHALDRAFVRDGGGAGLSDQKWNRLFRRMQEVAHQASLIEAHGRRGQTWRTAKISRFPVSLRDQPRDRFRAPRQLPAGRQVSESASGIA
jgi:hypothetical protein